jgi:hypothetical protein
MIDRYIDVESITFVLKGAYVVERWTIREEEKREKDGAITFSKR